MPLEANRPTHVVLRYPLAAFFVLAYGISWLLWAPLWLPAFGVHGLPVLPFHHALGALGPISAAFTVSAVESGRAGPGDLVRRMGLWRGRLRWVAVALIAPYVLLGLAVIGAALLGGEPVVLAGLGGSREFPQFSALGFLAYNVVSFGYGEEAGWRGFALPRLQTRHSALAASLLLTVGWALWHVPLFFYRPGYTGMNAAGIAGWLFSLVTGAVLLTWLYNESRGSILVVALFHATVDVAFTSGVASPSVVNLAGAMITVWGIVVLAVYHHRDRASTFRWGDSRPVAIERNTVITNPSSRMQLFDDWAKDYDATLTTSDNTFPHGGYEEVSQEVVRLADVKPHMKILDIGVGTGNLTARFVDKGCTVWGLDFSEAMLAKALAKVPQASLFQADVLNEWPLELQQRFDRVVSAYVLHEFNLETKVRLLRRIATHYLSAGGYMIIADIAFPTTTIRADAHQRWARVWDEDEFYWAADEAIAACEAVGLRGTYKQVSSCGGVFTFAVVGPG